MAYWIADTEAHKEAAPRACRPPATPRNKAAESLAAAQTRTGQAGRSHDCGFRKS